MPMICSLPAPRRVRGALSAASPALATVFPGLPLALLLCGVVMRGLGEGAFMLGVLLFLPLWLAIAGVCHAGMRPLHLWLTMAGMSGAGLWVSRWVQTLAGWGHS